MYACIIISLLQYFCNLNFLKHFLKKNFPQGHQGSILSQIIQLKDCFTLNLFFSSWKIIFISRVASTLRTKRPQCLWVEGSYRECWVSTAVYHGFSLPLKGKVEYCCWFFLDTLQWPIVTSGICYASQITHFISWEQSGFAYTCTSWCEYTLRIISSLPGKVILKTNLTTSLCLSNGISQLFAYFLTSNLFLYLHYLPWFAF